MDRTTTRVRPGTLDHRNSDRAGRRTLIRRGSNRDADITEPHRKRPQAHSDDEPMASAKPKPVVVTIRPTAVQRN